MSNEKTLRRLHETLNYDPPVVPSASSALARLRVRRRARVSAHVYLEADHYEWIQRTAKATGQSLSSVVAELVRSALGDEPPEAAPGPEGGLSLEGLSSLGRGSHGPQ